MLSTNEFRQRVRQALTDSVPLHIRRAWSQAELSTWWATVAMQDTALVGWQPDNDEPTVQVVWRTCADLLGPQAAAQP